MEPIATHNLTKDYGSGRGVFDVSIAVRAGEVFGFLGPNGAGKSTTIRHLMGFSRPDAGDARLFGLDSFGHYAEVMGRVGYLPGEIALPAGLTGPEFLAMMRTLRRQKADRTAELLDTFALDPSGDTKRMSLGDKRKLAVVAAFMHDPEVLILDEPTSGLDIVMQERFVRLVSDEKARGKTILLSSHIFSEVDSTCDRIAIIKDGRIVSDFVADDLKHKTDKIYELTFADAARCAAFVQTCRDNPAFSVTVPEGSSDTAVVRVNDAHINELLRAAAHGGVVRLRHRRETLEDYFMRFYKEDKTFGGVA